MAILLKSRGKKEEILSRVFCKTVRAALEQQLESTVICRTLKLAQWKFGLLPETGVFASLPAGDPLEKAQRNSSPPAPVSLSHLQLLILLLLGLRGCGGAMGKGCPRPRSC